MCAYKCLEWYGHLKLVLDVLGVDLFEVHSTEELKSVSVVSRELLYFKD